MSSTRVPSGSARKTSSTPSEPRVDSSSVPPCSIARASADSRSSTWNARWVSPSWPREVDGAPVEFVFPHEGVSAVSEPVAILKSARNPQAAKAFVDFLLSRDGQALALRQGYVAAHPDVALPVGYPDRSAISLMPFDAAKALAGETAARKRFTAIFE